MSVTQIVSISSNYEALENSLRNLSTKKIVFITNKENIQKVIEIRNKIALRYKLPTEVKCLENSLEGYINLFKDYEDAVVHLIDHDYSNYFLINASMIAGLQVYFSNGNGLEKIPTIKSKFKEHLSEKQVLILEKLLESPMSVELLAREISVDETALYSYLHGRNGFPSKGMVNLGLVTDNELLELTELGRSVINS